MVDSAKGKAEDVRAGFDTLRVLVDAVDTQLGFFHPGERDVRPLP